jgi:serine/threonine protein kinase
VKKTIDRFTLIEALGGSGASSSVYKATETLVGELTRDVALKVLPVISAKDKQANARLEAELKALSALGGHPHIVTMLGAGISDGTPWIAMEYLPTNLASLEGDHPAPPEQVEKMLQQVLAALDAMHSIEPPMLHNDLKPANILIDRFSSFKVTDFGSATLTSLESTRALGTVRYAAPELLSREYGKVCPATDLYALGHIAYEMALGGRNYRRQFPAVFEDRTGSKDANPARWMAWHCSLPTVPMAVHEIQSDFPRNLSEVIAKLMAKPLHERYASAKEVLAQLGDSTPAPAPAAAGKPAPYALAEPGGAKTPTPPPLPGVTPAAPLPVRGRAIPVKPAAMTGGGAPAAQYYVRLRGKLSGPFDLATLQRQARQGLISRLHQVSEDRASWAPATTVEGLFS